MPNGDFGPGMFGKSRGELTLRRREFRTGKAEQGSFQAEARSFIIQDAGEFHGNLFEIAQAVNRFGKIVNAQLTSFHRIF